MSHDSSKPDLAAAHRHFSVDCFNRAWSLIEKPERTSDEDDQMLLLATTSLWHWNQRDDCTPRNLSIGHWQVSLIYALSGEVRQARHHVERCLAFAEGSPPVYIAYGHEALARAALLAGDVAVLNDHLATAKHLATAVTDPEDRRLLEADLLSLSNS